MNTGLLRHAVATVLTVYGIETLIKTAILCLNVFLVATVLTVYGIETNYIARFSKNIGRCNSAYRLRY